MSTHETLKKVLVNLEIPQDQTEVYLKLLELGEANYSVLSRSTGIKRTSLYPLIEKMERRGLVARIVDQKTIRPSSPHQLFENFQDNNLALYDSLRLFQGLTKSPSPLTNVKFYKGIRGVQKLLLDELEEYRRTKEKLLRVIGSALVFQNDPLFFRQYQTKRKEIGIHTRLIAHRDVKPFEFEFKHLNVKIHFFARENEFCRGRISCTQRRLTVINLLGDENGIIIESRGIAEVFAWFFDATWNLLSSTKL